MASNKGAAVRMYKIEVNQPTGIDNVDISFDRPPQHQPRNTEDDSVGCFFCKSRKNTLGDQKIINPEKIIKILVLGIKQ